MSRRKNRHNSTANDRPLSRLAGFAVTALLAALVLIATQGHTPNRSPQVRHGLSGKIAGVVLIGESRDLVVDATVALRNIEDGSTRQVVTDANGKFQFKDLASGRYLIYTTKPGYVASTYGAQARGKPGMVLALADGQAIENLDVRLVRGAVLSGRVVDDSGGPVAGAEVSAIERVATDAGVRWARTAVVVSDDRGMYRLFGLAQGEYAIVAVRADLGAGPAPPRLPSGAPSASAMAGTLSEGAAARRAPSFSPVFYPSATDPTAIPMVAVRTATDQADMTIAFRTVPGAEIQGRIVGPPSAPLRAVRVMLIAPADTVLAALGYPHVRFATVSPAGHFVFTGIPPGSYTVYATTVGQVPARAQQSAAPARDWYALTTAVVPSSDHFVGLETIALTTGSIVSGRLVTEGSQASVGTMDKIDVRLIRADDGQKALDLPPARADAEGTFTFRSVPPGRYTIAAALTGGVAGERVWHVARATARGRDAFDAPFEIAPGDDVTDVSIVWSNRPTELTSTLLNAANRPSSDYYVVVFSTNREFWHAGSRWLRAPVRPASDGTLRIIGLPPGDYYMAAVTEYDSQTWSSPSFLQQLVPTAVRVSLAEGQTKAQVLRVATHR